MAHHLAAIREHRVLRVVGVVGFRPHVHVLATRLGLTGFVQNRTGDVWIEIEGDPPRHSPRSTASTAPRPG